MTDKGLLEKLTKTFSLSELKIDQNRNLPILIIMLFGGENSIYFNCENSYMFQQSSSSQGGLNYLKRPSNLLKSKYTYIIL